MTYLDIASIPNDIPTATPDAPKPLTADEAADVTAEVPHVSNADLAAFDPARPVVVAPKPLTTTHAMRPMLRDPDLDQKALVPMDDESGKSLDVSSKGHAMTDALPDTLHELMTLAIADYQRVLTMPEVYKIDMNQWHVRTNRVCHVCWAGAVLAGTLGRSPDETYAPEGSSLWHKLLALDQLRRGSVGNALQFIKDDFDEPKHHPLNRSVPKYPSPDFLPAMIHLRNDLREAGL